MASPALAAYPVSERDAVAPSRAAVQAAADALATPCMMAAPGAGTMKPNMSSPSLFRMLEDINHATPGMRLNLKPTLLFGVPVFLFALLVSSFLEYYALSTAAHLAIFVVGAYVVFSSYFVAAHYLSGVSQSYKAIPDQKKFYVLSNLIKSAVLLAYSPLAAKTLYVAMYHDEWSSPRIRNLGVLYAIPDAVSMLLVERMAWSTKVHHLCVVIFMVVNLFVSYEEESVGRALVVYAVFSTFAYLVNMLLASRFLPVAPTMRLLMSILALVVYGGCLAVNWTWQVTFLWRLIREQPTVPIFVYIGLISFVVADDVILLHWLYKNVGRTARMARVIAQGAQNAKRQ